MATLKFRILMILNDGGRKILKIATKLWLHHILSVLRAVTSCLRIFLTTAMEHERKQRRKDSLHPNLLLLCSVAFYCKNIKVRIVGGTD